jgi:CheY-like chemotaxis protein
MAWTFLVVDDNEVEAGRAVQQLRAIQPGAEVLSATSGGAAIRLLEERRIVPSLTFVDFSMPGMNGIEFLGQMRQRRWLERAPVAILSEPVDDRHVVNCYRLGACAFLTKPAKTHELRETLRDFAQPSQQMTAATVVPATPAQRSGFRVA